MNTSTLKIGQEKKRGNKFGIYAGSVCLQRFKTQEAAKKALTGKRSFYQYWAESASVMIDNSKKVIVWL